MLVNADHTLNSIELHAVGEYRMNSINSTHEEGPLAGAASPGAAEGKSLCKKSFTETEEFY